ncbi:hypothetical protein, partial [Caminibacter mediatlanticus]
MNLSVKDLAALKTFKNQFDKRFKGKEVEQVFKEFISKEKINDICKNSAEAWESIQNNQKIQVEKNNKTYYLFNYFNNIYPFFYRSNYSLVNDDLFLKKYGEDIYKSLGSYALQNQTKLKKICNLSNKDNIEVLLKALPNELRKNISVVQNSSFSIKRNVISDSDIVGTLKNIKLYEKFNKYLNQPDYLLKKEIDKEVSYYINLGDNYYLKDINKNNKEVLQYFNYKTSNI